MATLKSGSKAEENADLFSELPEDILVSIMSFFTMKEAAKFSLVSRQCEVTWRYFPVLIFEDYQAKKKIWDSWDAILEEKACFVRRVDRVVEKHLGTTIDELRITFDLEDSSQSYVDKWVAFALDKQVKRLELNFTTIGRKLRVYDCRMYQAICISLDLPPRLFTGFKSVLTSLCLRYVNVTDEFVDYLPLSCPLLETLCIEGSRYLTRVTGSLLVKQFEVLYCRELRKIDVSAPKLHSLTLTSAFPIELHIVDAPSLFKMSIGEGKTLPHAFDNLSDILSQLVYLNLMFSLPLWGDLMNGVAMPKLQHLELTVTYALINSCLDKCRFVIDASPNLQKLTLKLENLKTRKFFDQEVHAWWVGCRSPLKCLKTLEIVGYWGTIMDLELAFFVLENASMLEEIILDFVPLNDNDKRERLVLLQRRLPQGVKLTVK